MVDLTTTYLGLKLKEPAGGFCCPTDFGKSGNGKKVGRSRDCRRSDVFPLRGTGHSRKPGIGPLSIHWHRFLARSNQLLSPGTGNFTLAPEAYIEAVNKTKKAVKIPVIGSLNGVSTGGWIKYARKIEEAGADALELNLYYLATDPELTAQ